MSETPITISNLNDYIFCPASIYFHSLDYYTDTLTYQDSYQINGTAAHNAVDSSTYSDNKNILQSISVYSERYNLFGKIDLFDTDNHILTERKKKVNKIYEGYIFQVYAQYFGLTEMGYRVHKIRIYSMDDNKMYPIALPGENPDMLKKFEVLIKNMNKFELETFTQENIKKCSHCIYESLCSFSRLKE
ncbi:MAG: type V CRISPR-associated protein Cas4 [Oscillospiraceae bacterium]|nr:type V CRISPR-associated protein Cas4 [Oscillospiraceae bacterium]